MVFKQLGMFHVNFRDQVKMEGWMIKLVVKQLMKWKMVSYLDRKMRKIRRIRFVYSILKTGDIMLRQNVLLVDLRSNQFVHDQAIESSEIL